MERTYYLQIEIETKTIVTQTIKEKVNRNKIKNMEELLTNITLSWSVN